MNFDWNAIRSFLRVAKTGTLSAAAADLGLSQPTVGRHISRLEDSLQLRLFDHNQSGFELTPAGEQLLEAANNMALSAADVQRRAKAANPVRESVRVTIEVRPWSLRLASRNIERLTPDTANFGDDRPINFTFLSQDEYLSISRLEADLAIRNRVPKQGNLISVKLGYLTYRIFGSECYCKEHANVFDPEKLAKAGLGRLWPHPPSLQLEQGNRINPARQGTALHNQSAGRPARFDRKRDRNWHFASLDRASRRLHRNKPDDLSSAGSLVDLSPRPQGSACQKARKGWPAGAGERNAPPILQSRNRR